MPAKAPKTARYPEVERKFEVVDSTVSPSFEGIAAVARVEKSPIQALDAVYFDTPAQDLARRKITLRRRIGGNDAGWHLKLPAGPDTRTEIRAPLATSGGAPQNTASQDAVPNELLDVVLAIVRDRSIEPIAHITTERESHVLYSADGIALAEFSDDRVTAAATAEENQAQQRWREWELELITPNGAADRKLLNRLTKRLLDAGAASAGHDSKLARVLNMERTPTGVPLSADPVHRAVAEQVGELLRWDRAVRADAHDAVHQMRVAIRKIRSLLSDSPDAFGLSEHAEVVDELRELAGVLGVARDAEVLGQRYQCALDQLPAEFVRGPIRERLVEGAQRRYQTGLRRSLIAMRSPRYFRLLDSLDALLTESPPAAFDLSSKSGTPINIDAAYNRVRKAAKAAAQKTDQDSDHDHDEALHRIRKRAKRLRYTAAAIGADRVSQQAKNVQTLLGDHQDSVVSRQHLIRQADTAHAAGEDTFTYGLLFRQEAEMADRCGAQLDVALRQLAKSVRKARS